MSKPLIWETLLLATALSAGPALAQSPQDDATAPAGDAEGETRDAKKESTSRCPGSR